MKRLIEKMMDLQDRRKEDLIVLVLENDLVNPNTKTEYLWRDLEVLTYDELVDLIIDSQEVYEVELLKNKERRK